MKLIVTEQNLGLWAASFIKERVQSFAPTSKKPFVLGLPTGGTVVDMYAHLCALCQRGELDFQHIYTFNMDEYVGIPAQDEHSYHYYMKHHLFDSVNLPASQAHILNGLANDLQQECDLYEQAIKQIGGIHLFLGGVGQNGHLAFNEPGSSFSSRTRPVTLEPNTRQANARFFDGDITRVPTQALSVGIGTVLEAREILFLASGEKKAQAVARLSLGEITPQWPITALKTHANATLLVDKEAASLLVGRVREELQQLQQKNPRAAQWQVEL